MTSSSDRQASALARIRRLLRLTPIRLRPVEIIIGILAFAGCVLVLLFEPSDTALFRARFVTATGGLQGKLISALGKGSGLAWMALAISWCLRKRLLAYRMLLALVLTGVLVAGIKGAVGRDRPDGGDYSFPSGDSAGAAAGGVVLATAGPAPAVAAALMWGLVSLRRLARERHYPSDVAFGAWLGVVCGLFMVRSIGSVPPWYNRLTRATGLGLLIVVGLPLVDGNAARVAIALGPVLLFMAWRKRGRAWRRLLGGGGRSDTAGDDSADSGTAHNRSEESSPSSR